MRVLLVEDNAFVAAMMREELSQSGYEVVGPVGRADTAREIAENSPADCALVDIDLSDGRTGGELSAYLSAKKRLPVVFVTGQSDVAREYADAALGALIKPVDPNLLVRTVQEIEKVVQGQEPDWPAQLEVF